MQDARLISWIKTKHQESLGGLSLTLDSWQQSVAAPHLLSPSKKMPKPTFRVMSTAASRIKKKNHHCSEIQSTRLKPVGRQTAAQQSSACCWTSRMSHRRTDPPNRSLTGKFPLSKMHAQVVTSLKNESGWRTPGGSCSSVARYFR